jgi:predicted TIM-barrel fold metal-dependent hydrolase
MGAGRIVQGYLEQLRQLSDIKKKFQDQVFPFIFIDPRRPNITDLVKEYIEEHSFHGIKMNPTYGYYPFDKRLHNIFKYVEDNKVPVISHCARSWAYYKGEITDDMLTHPETGRKLKRTWKKKFAENFTHPGNYEYLLRDFPNLKICLAHLGGVDEFKKHSVVSGSKREKENWSSIIIDYIKRYPNVYTDVSYTMHDGHLFPTLKEILKDQKVLSRVLYGSDFYMVQQEISESDFHVNLKSSLGEKHYYQIAKDNPQRFLSMANS